MEEDFDTIDNAEHVNDGFSCTVGDNSFGSPSEMDFPFCDNDGTGLMGGHSSMGMTLADLTQTNHDTNPTYADNFGNTHDSCLEHDNSYDELAKIKQDLDDEIDVSDKELDELHNRADGIEREEHHEGNILKGVKICATRHGCSGATNCDYEYGAPVGR